MSPAGSGLSRGVPVAARGLIILRWVAQRGADSGPNRFLADVQVDETGKLTLLEQAANLFLEAANTQNSLVNVKNGVS